MGMIRLSRPRAISARVTRSAAQTIATDTPTAVSFDVVRHDTTGMYNPATPSRLTFMRAGVWFIGSDIDWEGVAGVGVRQVEIMLNGTTLISNALIEVGANDDVQTSTSTVYRFDVGDYVECQVTQTSAADCDVLQANEHSPELYAHYVGP